MLPRFPKKVKGWGQSQNRELLQLLNLFLIKNHHGFLAIEDVSRIPVVHGIHYGFKPIMVRFALAGAGVIDDEASLIKTLED